MLPGPLHQDFQASDELKGQYEAELNTNTLPHTASASLLIRSVSLSCTLSLLLPVALVLYT